MSISTLFGTRLLSGLGALALTGTLAGGTALAGAPAKQHEVRDLHHEVRDSSKAEREEVKALRKQLAAEYAKENPDATELRRLHEEIEAKREHIADVRFEALLSMHDKLDAAQRERVAERIAGKDKPEHGKDKDKPEHGKDKDKAEHGKGKPEGKGKDKAERGKGKGKDKDKPESDRRPI